MNREKLSQIVHEAKQYALIILAVLVARTFILQPFYVPSGSMEPTLQIGDELVASKFAYGFSRFSFPVDLPDLFGGRLLERAPERGDVVVFRLPRDTNIVYVKRIVGIPGDRLRMIDGRLFINGEKLDLQDVGADEMELQNGRRIPARRLIETLPGGRRHTILKVTWSGPLDNTDDIIVPPGMLFMMGDDRDNSLDSRVSAEMGGVGFVPMDHLVGRAEVILGSLDFPLFSQPVSEWLGTVRWSRFFNRIN